jgi:hypothetical protein
MPLLTDGVDVIAPGELFSEINGNPVVILLIYEGATPSSPTALTYMAVRLCTRP